MICKPVPRRGDIGGGKSRKVVDLSSYIANPETINREEKCVEFGAKNFICEDLPGMQAEMIALAYQNTGSKDPISHYVMSWPENEQPSPAQMREAVNTFVDHLGLGRHQIIWGAHADTHNIHIHIMINRIDPETLKATDIARGWDKRECAKVATKIEHMQGWAPEKNAQYVVLDGGTIVSTKDPDGKKKVSGRNRDAEIRTGLKSGQRIGIEEAAPIIEAAISWQDLHSKLRAKGIAYEKAGSGAHVVIGDVRVKASSVSRDGALKKLEKKFGRIFEPYVPKEELKNVTQHKSNPELRPESARSFSGNRMRVLSECGMARNGRGGSADMVQTDVRADRRAPGSVRRQPAAAGTGRDGSAGDNERNGRARGSIGRVSDFPRRDRPGGPAGSERAGASERGADAGGSGHRGGLVGPERKRDFLTNAAGDYQRDRREYKEAREAAIGGLRAQQQAQREALLQEQREERQRVLAGNWRGKGAALNAMRSVLAQQQAVAKLELKERHAEAMKQLRASYPHFPDFEGWLRTQGREKEADRWRIKDDAPGRIEGKNVVEPRPIDIRDFHAVAFDHGVTFERQPGEPGFTDYGKRIEVEGWKNRETTLAALQLSAQKWGSFTITGPQEYKELCAKLAAENGLRIDNPEMKEMIRAEKELIERQRAEAMKTQQLKEFEKIHEAVGAERYRVTVGRFGADNKLAGAFLIDKRKEGFTPEEMAVKTSEMIKLHSRGENLYLTPLSEKDNFIVVDDLTRPNFDRMMKDGFKPCALLETSPQSYQAILRIPKTGLEDDYEAGKRLAQQLNKEYGDPEVTNMIQPFRAPGYTNQKPKHERPDGTFPPIRLLDTRDRECEKSTGRLIEIAAQVERERAEHAARIAQRRELTPATPRQEVLTTAGKPGVDLNHVYARHQLDITTRLRDVTNQSRIDSMIATRMRVTGFQQDEIRQTIFNNTSRTTPDSYDRKATEEDLQRYSDRTASYPWAPQGERQAEGLKKYEDQWRKLEGRPTRAEEKAMEGPQGPRSVKTTEGQGQQAPAQEKGAQGPERDLPENQLAKVAEQERAEAERQERDRQRSSGPGFDR